MQYPGPIDDWPIVSIAAAVILSFVIWKVLSSWTAAVSSLRVQLTPGTRKSTQNSAVSADGAAAVEHGIPCYDPATAELICSLPAMTADEVAAAIDRAQTAAQTWRSADFKQRKLFLRLLLKYIIDHQEDICRIAAKDSGKPMVDAAFGEVMVTCEKLAWLLSQGEHHLKPERRSAGSLMFYKSARVEYHPLGVVGAIVPWNYPFHNLFNPVTAAVFAGNAIVVKVSEHASWSSLCFMQIISAALQASGAPEDLVQIVTGYGEAGAALTRGRIDKLIFVGSTEVGRKVMMAAAERLTPLTLELGGKDAFIVCDDADMSQALPTALRGAFQSCGQNCAGAERFIVHAAVYAEFCQRAAETAKRMRQGPPLGAGMVDAGAMCLPGLAQKVAQLVEEAVAQGAQLLAGGRLVRPEGAEQGQYYAPTVLAGITPAMRIWQEEVFGPVMAIIKARDDDDAVRLANDCPFGLGSAVFSGSQARARAIACQLQVGMSSINDFATTYMCQSLPFGGVKESGFGRFAGVEGLRALCVTKAVCDDRAPWLMKTTIPPLLQYPVGDAALSFTSGLIALFYAPELSGKLRGVLRLIQSLLPGRN